MAIKPKKFKLDTSGLDAVNEQLDDYQKVIDNKNAIHKEACEEVTPFFQDRLSTNLAASGVKSVSGNLKKEIADAQVVPAKSGIIVKMKSGLKDKEYKKAAALTYGAIHNTGIKNKKARKSLKQAAFKGEEIQRKEGFQGPETKTIDAGDGMWIQRPKGVFKLTNQDIEAGGNKYVQVFADKLEKVKSKYKPEKEAE